MKSKIQMALTVATAVFVVACSTLAQRNERFLTCEQSWGGRNNGQRHCEMKEQSLPATGAPIRVDGKRNGGVSIKGWDRNEILVRAQITAQAPTEDEARALVNEVRVLTGGANIYADGPETRDQRWWAVSYEVFVPRQSDVSLKAQNGGISIDGVRGALEFDTTNGGVSLRDVNGKVKGRTTNGGLSVKLSGNRWEGEGMDVETRNGGVQLLIPENYSARLESGTVNGGINLGFPINVAGKVEKSISTDLGSGGATIRLMTTNGGVSVKKQ
ncbi:MAG TPA: DUF4097 family beta strand repeat-containing protein [Blastocatellia bacterium]|nr:DUF4097 family beta strand repeat-containing protein [Blastocatellia bacterium]